MTKLMLACLVFTLLISSTFAAQMPIDFQSDNFGWRFMSDADYTSNGVTYSVFHPAVDLNAANDNLGETPVYAIANGTVVANDDGWGGIVIRHTFNGENYYSQYGHIYHLDDETAVEDGKEVQEGQQIGFIGDVGSEGVHHLHFEIRSPHHPDPDNAGYWGSYGANINERKEVFEGYEAPLAFIRSHTDQDETLVIIDSAVTYSRIEDDIIDNEVCDDNGNSIKQNFFKAWNLSEWNTYVAGVGESRGFEGNYHYAPTTDGNESSAGKWFFNLPEDGNYEVFVSIPANHATSEKATYEVYHNYQYDFIEVNQNEITGSLDERWVSLGSLYFTAGSEHHVKLSNATGEKDKYIGFDAVKLEYASNQQSTIEHNITPPSSVSVTQGGKLGPIEIIHINNTNSGIGYDINCYIVLPDGGIKNSSRTRYILAGETKNFELYLSVPNRAQIGTYMFGVQIDYTESDIKDYDDSFEFTVTPGCN